MSKSISFELHFSEDVSPASLVLGSLQAGFNNFFRPKMGKISADDRILEFGLRPFEQVYETTPPFEGEEILAPGITSLTQYPDATQEIVNFLAQFSKPSRSFAQFAGDCRLDYAVGENIVEGWLFRHGDDSGLFPIMWCDVRRILKPTGVGLIISYPWFFLKDWPEGDEPRYSTPKTAEHNWNRIVDCARLLIDVAGEDKLEEVYLNLEGSLIYQEREWLIEYAQRLPKLQVHVA